VAVGGVSRGTRQTPPSGAGLRRAPGWGRRLRLVLAVAGPGLIAANADNDAGGITTLSVVGADYGYQMLWALVLITFSLAITQEMGARTGAVTGKGLASLIRERYRVKTTLLAMVALLIANFGTTVAEFAGVGAALELFGVPRYVSVPIAAALVWLLVIRGNYRSVERVLLVMSVVYLSYVLSAFLAEPDWGGVARSVITPTLRLEAGFWSR
jgi:NRAMP (natural resistance-associated macrophage protein)-like metal ion transporter